MIIKIISLKNSTDRRDHISRQLSNLDLIYEFEDAIDATNYAKTILNFFSKRSEFRYGKSAKLGDMACSYSHYQVRKKFLNLSIPKSLMVLEDDAEILCNRDELFSIERVFKKSNFDILILGFSKCDDSYERHVNIINPILQIFRINDKFSIGPRYLKSTSGTVGYLINHKSAKIMNKISLVSPYADDWDHFSKLGLKIAYISPMIIRENTTKFLSTIDHNNHYLSQMKSKNVLVNFLIYIRKYIYGYLRKIFLLLKYYLK